jgi:hypothetical protein
MKSVGTCTARFYDSGSDHDVELTWGRAEIGGFPIKIVIDGQLAAESRVSVDNWLIGLWPLVLVAAAIVWALWLSR